MIEAQQCPFQTLLRIPYGRPITHGISDEYTRQPGTCPEFGWGQNVVGNGSTDIQEALKDKRVPPWCIHELDNRCKITVDSSAYWGPGYLNGGWFNFTARAKICKGKALGTQVWVCPLCETTFGYSVVWTKSVFVGHPPRLKAACPS
eukprot:1193533-Prorocentrum_minimum.AAC.5